MFSTFRIEDLYLISSEINEIPSETYGFFDRSIAFCIIFQQKEVVIPSGGLTKNRKNVDGLSETPSFVRNVMGSSAGAGSGEFHVYRHLRRKEYARQKDIQQQGVKVLAHRIF